MEKQAKDGTVYQQVSKDEWTPVTRTAKDGTVYKKMGEDAWTPMESNATSAATPKAPEESLGRRLARSTIDTVLPVGGAAVAGLLATPETLGLGTIPAAAAGYAGGKQLARIVKHYALGDDAGAGDIPEQLKQTAGDLQEGAMMEMGGQVTGKALEMAAPYVAPVVKPVAEKVSKAVKAIGEAFGSSAEAEAAKAVGAGAKEFEKPLAAKALGRNALDKKLIGPYTSAEETLAKATAEKKAAGKSMETVHKTVDDTLGPSIDPLNTAVQVEKELAPTYRTPINKSEVNQLENTIESVLARGDKHITLEEAQALKKEIDTVAYPKGKKPLDPSPKQQMAADASNIVREQIDKAAQAGAEKIGNQDLVAQLETARKSYGLNRQTEKLATKKVGKEGAGVGEKINWTVDPIKMGASIVKKYLPNASATKAIALDKISSVLTKSPEVLGEFAGVLTKAQAQGPQHLATAHLVLEQTNPAYRQMIQKAADSETPKKGTEKWANDGIENILKSDQSGLDRSVLEGLKKSPKGQMLLFEASTAKDKKSMDRVLQKIRSASRNEAE